MKPKLVMFLFVLLEISIPTCAQQQPVSSPANSQGTPELGAHPSIEPLRIVSELIFDPVVQKLPFAFSGHDIKAVYTELYYRSIPSRKGEFETTKEFEDRVRDGHNKPILGSKRIDSLFAFNLTNSIGSNEIRYDADDQKIKVSIPLYSISTRHVNWTIRHMVNNRKAITSQSKLEKSSYEALNALGAKIRVSVIQTDAYKLALAMTNYSRFGVVTNWLDRRVSEEIISISMPMEIASAKKVKSRLRIMAIVWLKEPHTFKELDPGYAPTFRNPTTHVSNSFYLNAELLEVWVYDDASGEILAKKKPDL